MLCRDHGDIFLVTWFYGFGPFCLASGVDGPAARSPGWTRGPVGLANLREVTTGDGLSFKGRPQDVFWRELAPLEGTSLRFAKGGYWRLQ